MTANCEPSNQSFEIDRDATVCTASRRFLAVLWGSQERRIGFAIETRGRTRKAFIASDGSK